jgi:hypothetical protein
MHQCSRPFRSIDVAPDVGEQTDQVLRFEAKVPFADFLGNSRVVTVESDKEGQSVVQRCPQENDAPDEADVLWRQHQFKR